MDIDYSKYAQLRSKIADTQKVLAKDRQLCDKMEKEIIDSDKEGGYAIKVSTHAYNNISKRLETITEESPKAYTEIVECDPDKSLFKPSNLVVFIIAMICKARELESYKTKKSRDNGTEYHYSVNLSKWSTDQELFFTCIVENHVVKTGFFNFVG